MDRFFLLIYSQIFPLLLLLLLSKKFNFSLKIIWLQICHYYALQTGFAWFFLSSGFFCASLPYRPVLCRALDMVDWLTFTLFSAELNWTELCRSFRVIVSLSVASQSFEGPPFLGDTRVVWCSCQFLTTYKQFPLRYPVFCTFFALMQVMYYSSWRDTWWLF